MSRISISKPFRWLCMRAALVCAMTVCLALVSAVRAEAQSPLARVKALGLEKMTVGRVTVHFASTDLKRANQLATLTESAAAFLEKELGTSFDLSLAVLGPVDWFSEYPGIPYAIPWESTPDRLIMMPSSLREGLLIRGPSELDDRRRVDFVLLHEYGHLAARDYFRSDSDPEYLASVPWFEELLATYFGYAFVYSSDSAWAEAARRDWLGEVKAFTPREVSLDWSFMSDLPGPEIARTYGWYQVMLNLRVADIYEQRGLGFLRELKEELPWNDSHNWTTASLFPLLEKVSPGFDHWAESLQSIYGKQGKGN